jgi:tetratricopeptide (TPR) repeat protein
MNHSKRLQFLRWVVAILMIASCALAGRSAWRAGLSRLLATYAARAAVKERADQAVEMSPMDAEAHSARALVLYRSSDTRGALAELERAILLRPVDYLLWLQLGRARDESGDKEGALLALQESIRRAPYYAEPRWQYGNVLYRLGRFADAFPELRQAAESDPAQVPVLIDLAWSTYHGNVKTVEDIIGTHTDNARLSLASYFLKKGESSEGLRLLRTVTTVSSDYRRALLADLLKARRFTAAYEVWSGGNNSAQPRPPYETARITDPGFEGRLDLNTRGFSWRQERAFEGVTPSLETKRPRSGLSCLLVEWNGHAVPEVPVMTQLVLVEPRSRYHLSFFVRTEDVVTGGLPVITITDASGDQARTLVESKPFPQGTSDWQEYEMDFETPATTEAVVITLQRQSCAVNPCPMFGRIWLDDFALRKSSVTVRS